MPLLNSWADNSVNEFGIKLDCGCWFVKIAVLFLLCPDVFTSELCVFRALFEIISSRILIILSYR